MAPGEAFGGGEEEGEEEVEVRSEVNVDQKNDPPC